MDFPGGKKCAQGLRSPACPLQLTRCSRHVIQLRQSRLTTAVLFIVFVELCTAHLVDDSGAHRCVGDGCSSHDHSAEQGAAHTAAGERGGGSSLAAQMDGETLLSYQGPVEAVWIEETSTLLDAENELCLVSGELITV